jgi:hypothetical protein
VTTGTALQAYSCCSSADIDAVRHPGETMSLHWIATPIGPSAASAVSSVRLGAELSGPFDSVSALKAADNTPATLTAPVIVTTNQVGSAPVSVIVIPKDAAAGYYNLTTTIDQDGGQVTGGSILKVAVQ